MVLPFRQPPSLGLLERCAALGWPAWPSGADDASAVGRSVASPSMTDIVVVRVKPGSRKGPLVETGSDAELTIYVRERAVDGKANEAAARLLAAHLQLPRSRVELVAGATSRLKRFRVER